jgi:hypothetical protein
MKTRWQLNLPQVLGLADASFDDADVDAAGNIYISDSINCRIYKLGPDGSHSDTFSIACHASDEAGLPCMNLAAAPDSTIFVADQGRQSVIRYNDTGQYAGEFPSPGALSLCYGPNNLVHVLSNADDIERIDSYDIFGGQIGALPAPARCRARLDPSLVNLDADSKEGCVYVSYGMPPYRIWKVKADGSEMDVLGRSIDYPEDAVLISDIAVDSAGVLWVLLACRHAGRQVLDAFGRDGSFLGTFQTPHSDNLYGVLCASEDCGLLLLNTGAVPGMGDLLCIATTAD